MPWIHCVTFLFRINVRQTHHYTVYRVFILLRWRVWLLALLAVPVCMRLVMAVTACGSPASVTHNHPTGLVALPTSAAAFEGPARHVCNACKCNCGLVKGRARNDQGRNKPHSSNKNVCVINSSIFCKKYIFRVQTAAHTAQTL